MTPQLRLNPQHVVDLAAKLDRLDPDWFNRVDVGSLELKSLTHCVIAQAFGERSYMHTYVRLDPDNSDESSPQGAALADDRYKPFWVTEIQNRFRAKS